MQIRKTIATVGARATGWKMVGKPVLPKEGAVVIGAPHTSNWDFIVMFVIAWHAGIPVKWLGKAELFKGVGGPVMKMLGGIPVDRKTPGSLVTDLADQLRETPGAMLIMSPEGTRGKSEYWKSGFYRIARDANLPVVLTHLDSETKTLGVGPTIVLTGDVSADMDKIREFYKGKKGIRPGNETVPRLRMEEDVQGA